MEVPEWCATGSGRPSVIFESVWLANRESEPLECVRERCQVERFDKVSVEPGGLRCESEAAEPGQRDRRDRADRRRQPAHLTDEPQTILARHSEIGNDQIGLTRLQTLQRRPSGRGRRGARTTVVERYRKE